MKLLVFSLIAQSMICSTAVASSERWLNLRNVDSSNVQESIKVKYRNEDGYEAKSLEALNHFLRDRNTGEIGNIDPAVLDFLWDITQASGVADCPIIVVRGYGERKLLERKRKIKRSKKNLHSRGQALDFKVDCAPASKLRDAAIALNRGGVGYYKDSFVHIDTGKVRHWPRKNK